MTSNPTRAALVFALVVLTFPAAARAQNAPAQARPLSLEEALSLSEERSEAVAIARAGVTRATGRQYQVRSERLPQLDAVVSYTRTLQSQFSGLDVAPPDTGAASLQPVCAPEIPPDATSAERSAALAQAISCVGGGGFDFGRTGFGAANTWVFGFNFLQNVYTGGRIAGQTRAAAANRQAAEVEVLAQRAQLALEVAQAYFDAQLADQLVRIARSSLAQTDEVLRQTRLARQVGNQSEFELLRAQVTRDNQVPVLLQRQSDRDVAYLRLKQILDLPLDDSLALTTSIEDASGGPVMPDVEINGVSIAAAPADSVVGDRAPVRQSEANVQAQEGLLRAARAARKPQVAIISGYQRLFFPAASAFPSFADFRQNWSVGVQTTLSLLSGGRITGDVMVARANLDEARARLQQTRELASLDTRIAYNSYAQAQAAFQASQGTAEQASRAYAIDQIRFREGISTQTDLTQSRILLEQAVVNRVSAARDLAVARIRLALLRDLPLQTGGAGASGAALAAQSQSGTTDTGGLEQQQRQQEQVQQRAMTQSAARSGGSSTGGIRP